MQKEEKNETRKNTCKFTCTDRFNTRGKRSADVHKTNWHGLYGCHVQHMPRLNKFGRKFAASGMTISKQVADVNNTSEMDINPSLLIKSKYTKTTDKPDGKGAIKEDDTNDGDLSIVRAAELLVGGRISENVGGIVNLGWRKEEGDSISGKVVYVNEIEDGYWGTAFYSTSNFGPFSGMEFYNTGLYKPLRTSEMHIYTNANQSTRLGSGSATGIQVYYDKDNFINDSAIICMQLWVSMHLHRIISIWT